MKRAALKRIIGSFLILVMTFTIMLPVFASGISGANPVQTTSVDSLLDILPFDNPLGIAINKYEYKDLKTVNAKFPTPYNTSTSWDFPYSDEFFSQPESMYSHTFAQGSLGLSVASFKSSSINYKCSDDLNDYFTSIGFDTLYAPAYDQIPTADSVTYAIAKKQIGSDTVIAVVCCGAGYGAEWSGNLTVGEGERHEGFDSAAVTVEAALKKYISDYIYDGSVILWATGYSRAAAIANIVAADMTDSHIFKRVYGYTFATPLTTKSAGNYSNIFNVVGKNDPVASIPLVNWGFSRYGNTLYTPTIETDTDFYEKAMLMDEMMEKVDGHDYIYNPMVCSQLRTFFDYLYGLLPDEDDYSQSLQPGVLSVMANKNNDNIIALVSRIISTFKPKDEREKAELNNLIDYVQELANTYVLRGNKTQIERGMWATDLNITQNITTEHNPDKYISWMFLDSDPTKIFDQTQSFTTFTFKGKASIDIYNDRGFIMTINENGAISYDLPYENAEESSSKPELYIERGTGQINITVPGDMSYLFSIKSKVNQKVSYYAAVHSMNSVKASIQDIYSLDMEADKEYYMYFESNPVSWRDDINETAGATNVWNGTSFYSPSTIMRMQNLNVLHLTLSQITIALAVLLFFAYTELIVCITLAIVRLFLRHPRRSASTIFMHSLNAAVFLALEIALWYFVPAYPVAKLAAKIVSFIFIFSLAFVALTEHFVKRNLFINLGILAAMVASCLFENTLLPNLTFKAFIIKFLFYAGLIVAAAICWKGHSRRRALIIADVEAKRHEKMIEKVEKDIAKAYARSEKETQKYLAKQKALKEKEKRKAEKALRQKTK